MSLLFRGNSYHFSVRIDGNDLVVVNVKSTWFGGANDPEDNGETASGVSTIEYPETLGCALPLPGIPATRGTPLPKLRWFTTVQVTNRGNGRTLDVELID